MSYADAARPSRCAAIASTAPTVMTPVPPMPAIIRPYGAAPAAPATAGTGRPSNTVSLSSAALRFLGGASYTVTKLGQKPFTQL